MLHPLLAAALHFPLASARPQSPMLRQAKHCFDDQIPLACVVWPGPPYLLQKTLLLCVFILPFLSSRKWILLSSSWSISLYIPCPLGWAIRYVCSQVSGPQCLVPLPPHSGYCVPRPSRQLSRVENSKQMSGPPGLHSSCVQLCAIFGPHLSISPHCQECVNVTAASAWHTSHL